STPILTGPPRSAAPTSQISDGLQASSMNKMKYRRIALTLSLILGLLRIIIDEVILCKPDFKSLLAEDLPSPIPSSIASRLSRPAKERSQRFNRKSSLGGPI